MRLCKDLLCEYRSIYDNCNFGWQGRLKASLISWYYYNTLVYLSDVNTVVDLSA